MIGFIVSRSAVRRFLAVALYSVLAVGGGFVGGLVAGEWRLPLSPPVGGSASVSDANRDTVKAHKFVVLGSNGEARATFSAEATTNDQGALVFYDPKGPTTRVSEAVSTPERRCIGGPE